MRLSEYRRPALLFAAVLAFAVTLMGTASLLRLRDTMREGMAASTAAIAVLVKGQLEQSGRVMVRVLADNLVNPVYTIDMERIRELLGSVRDLEDVRYVYVYGPDGAVLHDGGRSVRQFGVVFDDEVSRNAATANTVLLQDQPKILDVSAPILIGDQRLGGVRIGLSKDRIDTEIAAMTAGTDLAHNVALDRNATAVVSTIAGLTLLGVLLVFAVMRENLARERSRRYEGDLARVSRVTVMGELASVLAHEINQPLAAVVNFSRGALRRLGRPDASQSDLKGALEQISTEAMRASAILRHINDFVRKSDVETTAADVNAMIRNIHGIMEGRAKVDSVAIRLELVERLPQVDANVIEIEQVILNLLINGVEALKAVRLKREVVVRSRLNDSGMVEVSVSDNGCGLPKEAQSKVFEPFFTTKPGGIGMGLRICRTIVEAHGGRIWALANTDRGSTFSFALPARPVHG